jgi:argininosuccinate lyase
MKLWDKGIPTHRAVEAFTIGRDREFDLALAPWDVLGSIAHALMLAHVKLISNYDAEVLTVSLRAIHNEIRLGTFSISPDMEDIHSQVEYILTNTLGEVGKKIHTGRSRNDQALTDIKLYLRSEIRKLAYAARALSEKLIQLGELYHDILIPGYTHMQIAMPSSFGLWFGSYAESLADDMLVLQGAYRFINRNPLGSAAGYGSSFPINRMATTKLLGFEGMNINSVYAQMTRGRTELIVARAISGIASTLARMAMDITLFTNQNYGFISFPDEFTTGSSIMPHKKNPDVFELIRAKCNAISGLQFSLMQLTTNLPSGYHRDYQITKEILFPAFEELHACINIADAALSQIKVHPSILEDKRYAYLYSVDAVNEKVKKGIPFRDAYKQVSEDIKTGTFQPPDKVEYTHLGSIGNPGLTEIREYLNREIAVFRFEDAIEAEKRLVYSDDVFSYLSTMI